ncbi:nuclear protein Es2-domain-containing protein [Verticillium dahliae]|nr:nuclear protein Es2-domain-containing protein [Verticillium dahliae]
MDLPPTQALVRKRADTDLMPPPPPTKKIKRPKKVIDEDAYTDALSQIIARDFFPGLLETETKQEYLDALESKDAAWISNAGQRLQRVMTPGRHTSQTPRRKTSHTNNGRTPSAYGADTPMSASTTAREVPVPAVDTNMSLASFQAKYTSEDNESFYKLLDKQNQKKAENLVDDGFKRDRLAIKDKRQAWPPDSWNANPRNGLMFEPEGVDDEYESPAQKAQAESRMAPKSINYSNTRVPEPAAIKRPASPTLTPHGGGSETPRVNGYAFVDDEMMPETVALPVIDLGPGDATPNPFKLQEQGKREPPPPPRVTRPGASAIGGSGSKSTPMRARGSLLKSVSRKQ